MGKPLDTLRPTPTRPEGIPIGTKGPFHVFASEMILSRKDAFGMEVTRDALWTPRTGLAVESNRRFPNGATMTAYVDTEAGTFTGQNENVYGWDKVSWEHSGQVQWLVDAVRAALKSGVEEIGIRGDEKSIVNLGTFGSSVINTENRTTHFMSNIAAFVEPTHQAKETIERAQITFTDALDRVLDGRMATSSVALHTLLAIDQLREMGVEIPHPRIAVEPNGEGLNEVPRPWKTTEVESRNGEIIEHRGGLAVVNRRILLDTDTEQVAHDTVLRSKPDGTTDLGKYFWLPHPPRVNVILQDEITGDLFFTKDYRYPYDTMKADLAGGTVETGESYKEAANRVLKGMDLDPTPIYDYGEWGEITSRFRHISRMVLAKVSSTAMDGREDIIRVPVKEGWETIRKNAAMREHEGLDMVNPALALGLLQYKKPSR